jgi:hypothetical protein
MHRVEIMTLISVNLINLLTYCDMTPEIQNSKVRIDAHC